MVEKIRISDSDRILVIAPHPDDECIGVGGILINYAKQCTVVVCTDGSRSVSNKMPEQLKEIREQEFTKEMNILGIDDFHFLEIPDCCLLQNLDLFVDFDFSNFTKIFFPHSNDDHPDHTAAYKCVANKITADNRIKAELYMYEVHKQLSMTTHYIDLSDSMEEKLELIRCHESQLSVNRYDEMAEAGALYRAIQLGLPEKYVEVFCKIERKELLEADSKHNDYYLEMYQKQLLFYQVLTGWMANMQAKKNIAEYLINKGIRTVIIYGFAELGKLLFEELADTEVEVLYVLDKRNKCNDKRVFFPQSDLGKADVVIVTAIYYYEDIMNELLELGYKNIISLKKIVDDVRN